MREGRLRTDVAVAEHPINRRCQPTNLPPSIASRVSLTRYTGSCPVSIFHPNTFARSINRCAISVCVCGMEPCMGDRQGRIQKSRRQGSIPLRGPFSL